jgi:hypothetical protein
MTTASLAAPESTKQELQPLPLPAWAAPATPDIERNLVGMSRSGDFYAYGDSPDQPGPLVPALLGVVTDITVSQHGASSRYGLRDYLDLTLQTPIPDVQVLLRLPCKASPHPVSGELLIPWSVRSLLAALQTIQLSDTAIKLQPRKGTATTFIRVLPFSPEGIEQPEIRCEAIGGSRDDLEIAVNHVRIQLGLPPLFLGVPTSSSSQQPAAEPAAA